MSRFIVEEVLISMVRIGSRRREGVGSLAKLKASLEQVGQIHPITLRMTNDGLELVAGERRLAAATALGWTRIRARIGKFTDDELRAIELDENTCRQDLTPSEASTERLRGLLRDAEAAKAAIGQNDLTEKRRGPKPGAAAILSGGDPKRRAAIKDQMHRDRKHVAAANEHPVFAGPGWRQSHVLAATEALEALPKRDQSVALDMISEPGVDPKSAVKMIETLAEKEPTERKQIADLYRSDDPEKRSLAKTRAAKLPPLPPPILADLDQAIRWLDSAARRQTPRADRYGSLASKARELREQEEKDYERLKAAERG